LPDRRRQAGKRFTLQRTGSHATQADRLRVLTLVSRYLREAGFQQMRATSLKGKHVDALLERWQADGLSVGTLKNRLAHLRWWAEKIGKAGVIPADNTQLGIPERRFVTNIDKSRELGDALDRVNDLHVRMSLTLQQAFGLRREEAIKFRPAYADRGDCIVLKGSWMKGGRERTVSITTAAQRVVLDQAQRLVGACSFIPAHKSYIRQRHVYDGQCKAAGLSHMHGLRHAYAQARYEALTGWKAPAAGGPGAQQLTPTQRVIDAEARQTISRELGHERTQIAAVYLGRMRGRNEDKIVKHCQDKNSLIDGYVIFGAIMAVHLGS
jgi:integrase